MSSKQGNKSEAGLASFMVTTVLIMVISLIIIGFTQVTRRNQQEALDRQLNSQAFYAAESGINAAISVIQKKVSSGQDPPVKSTCNDFSNYPDIELSGTDVEVTCLLVETNLANMYYDTVTEDAPTVAALLPATNVNIGSLTLTWRNSTGGPNASSTCNSAGAPNYNLPVRGGGSGWQCGLGLLRTDLSPQPQGGSGTAMSSFFYPHRVGGTVTPATAPTIDYASKGGLAMGHCSDADNDPKCMATINGLDAPIYYINLRSIYRNSTVTINGFDTAGNPLRFKGQVTIDVTAKAQDVLKRLQVRVPTMPQPTSTIPANAIETTDSLCKRFSVFPGYYSNDIACP